MLFLFLRSRSFLARLRTFSSSLETAKPHLPHQYQPDILAWMHYIYNHSLPAANGRPSRSDKVASHLPT